jgi:hypothetical protein
VLTALKDTGVPINTAEEDGPVPNKFWIFMSGEDTYEETKKEQAKLTELGVVDIYILRTEPYVNRISLGVYNDRAMADRRLRDLAKVNVNAQLEIQYKPGKQFWLEYQAQDSAAAQELVQQFTARFPAATLNSAPCRQ